MTFNEFLVYSIIMFLLLVLVVICFIITSVITVMVGNFFLPFFTKLSLFKFLFGAFV